MKKTKGIDKETFKQIFRDHYEGFRKKNPRYNATYYREAIEKMLKCADEKWGYARYICMKCLAEKKVPFTCKSSFCMSCAQIRLKNWLQQMGGILFEGVNYRHVVLTIPESLRIYFYRQSEKLSQFIQAGLEMLKELVRDVTKKKIECGYIVVLQTAGRSSQYNPHLHIMMTEGGLDSNGQWQSINYIPFDLLHKKWRYHLFEMMKREFGSKIKPLIDDLYLQYPRGIVAHIKMENVPKKERLAQYLMKYVGSPPIALSRIVEYDGSRVKYWYKDHQTGKRELADVDVLTFIGRMVQHILPKGFKAVRYYGLHATCKVKKVAEKLKEIFKSVGEKVAGLFKKKTYRERIEEMTGEDPLICANCDEEMILWQIWVPEYGTIYSAYEEMKNYPEVIPEDKKCSIMQTVPSIRESLQLQLSMF